MTEKDNHLNEVTISKPTAERAGALSLPKFEDLQTFGNVEVPLGAQLGAILERSSAQINCLVRDESLFKAADFYRRIIGRTKTNFTIQIENDPITTAQKVTDADLIPLVVTSAITPKLNELMFGNSNFGQLLADRFPVPNTENSKATPILHCVGIAKHGIKVLADVDKLENNSAIDPEEIRSQRINTIFGHLITPVDFRRILRSNLVRNIRIHVLGPVGTNISQAARKYAENIGITDKIDIIIYDAGITPLDYADIAADETQKSITSGSFPETLHLHVECAVYNDMWRLYKDRQIEAVFSDEQNMQLDTMQFAGILSMPELQEKVNKEGTIRIATHPSPKPLIAKWITSGIAKWIEASSNSAAALMVKRDEADACVTTASAVRVFTNHDLKTLHEFGSPNMIFTVASPLTQEQLNNILFQINRHI